MLSLYSSISSFTIKPLGLEKPANFATAFLSVHFTTINMVSFSRCFAAVLLMFCASISAPPSSEPTVADAALSPHARFRDDFSSFDKKLWRCQHSYPVIDDGNARFRLRPGVPPNNYGSWSKARYTGQRYTSGRFTVRFSLTDRPKENPVWWGVALWDDGPAADGSQFNEINFGYTTDQSYTNTQLRFESAKRGVYESVKVDTSVNLYDQSYHVATLEYNSRRVAFYLDGKLLAEIRDRKVIPTDPMDFILGPRLVTGGEPLTTGFTESVDWVEIQAWPQI